MPLNEKRGVTKRGWAPSQYTKRRLFVRSREVSKPRDWYFKLLYRFEIWQAHRQHCCRSACQISERSDNSKYKSRGFETLRDLTERRLFGYWDGALDLFLRNQSASTHQGLVMHICFCKLAHHVQVMHRHNVLISYIWKCRLQNVGHLYCGVAMCWNACHSTCAWFQRKISSTVCNRTHCLLTVKDRQSWKAIPKCYTIQLHLYTST